MLTENKSIGYVLNNSSNSSYNSNFESLSYKCDSFLFTISFILFNNSSSTTLLGVGFWYLSKLNFIKGKGFVILQKELKAVTS